MVKVFKNKQMQQPARKRIVYIDILNILAIIAVLFLHHNGIVHRFSEQRSWYTSLIFECVFYFAVPIFVMISGAMLLNFHEKYDTKTFFKKRMMKVLIPAIFWFIFVFIWKVFIVRTITIQDWSLPAVVNMFTSAKIETIYYYLFLILGLYITMPILSILARSENRKIAWYFVGVFFFMNALLPNLLAWAGISFYGGPVAEHGVTFGVMIGQYAMYAVLGYLLSTASIPKKRRLVLYALAALAILYHYLTTAILSSREGILVNTSWGYGQFHAIILASAVFLFIKNMNLKRIEKNDTLKKILSTLAGCSFGVYLLHMIVIYYELEWFELNKLSIVWRVVWPFLTYTFSVIIVLLMKRCPLLKRVVP